MDDLGNARVPGKSMGIAKFNWAAHVPWWHRVDYRQCGSTLDFANDAWFLKSRASVHLDGSKDKVM